MTGEDVVYIARGWLGTPYVHQHAVKGAGCDCLGLLRGVWAELGGVPPVAVPAYTMDWSEANREETLWAAAKTYLIAKSKTAAPGDILLFRMVDGAVAKHLGVQTEIGPQPKFIHAFTGHGVIENSLSLPWQRRIVARFCFPDVDKEVR